MNKGADLLLAGAALGAVQPPRPRGPRVAFFAASLPAKEWKRRKNRRRMARLSRRRNRS